VIADDDIRAACAKVRLASFPAGFKPHSSWHTRVQIALRGGKRLLCDSPSFEGMPEEPMGPDSLRAKFDVLTGTLAIPLRVPCSTRSCALRKRKVLHDVRTIVLFPRLHPLKPVGSPILCVFKSRRFARSISAYRPVA